MSAARKFRRRRPRLKWTGRADPRIAEAAEAVGCNTDDVMAVAPDDAGALVLFTADAESTRGLDPLEVPVTRARLERDAAGVLTEAEREPAGVFGDYWRPPQSPE